MANNDTGGQPNDPQQLIQQIIDDTVTKAGFGDLPAQFQQEYRDKLELALYKKVGTAINNTLSEEQVQELGKFLQKNPNPSNEQLFDFYNSKIADLPERIAEALKSFQRDFLNMALEVQGKAGMI